MGPPTHENGVWENGGVSASGKVVGWAQPMHSVEFASVLLARRNEGFQGSLIGTRPVDGESFSASSSSVLLWVHFSLFTKTFLQTKEFTVRRIGVFSSHVQYQSLGTDRHDMRKKKNGFQIV